MSPDRLSTPFAALADPIRRAIRKRKGSPMAATTSATATLAERKHVIRRVLDAPSGLVFKARDAHEAGTSGRLDRLAEYLPTA